VGSLVAEEKEDPLVKGSVYLRREEYRRASAHAKLLGMRGFSELVRTFLLDPVKALVMYLTGPYDWRDTWKAVRGETPDRERVWLDLTDWPDEELLETRRRLHLILDVFEEEVQRRGL